MSGKLNKEQSEKVVISQISKIFGSTQLLPNESVEAYNAGLESAIRELDARTHLQIYIAEKIFQCLWWVKRYETQKYGLAVAAMVELLLKHNNTKPNQHAITTLIQDRQWNDPTMLGIIKNNGYTVESLHAAALNNKSNELMKIDQQIALRIKTLGQLQQSYEALVNRSVLQERLRLQNDLIKRDLQAIDVSELNLQNTRGSKINDKPQTKTRQQG